MNGPLPLLSPSLLTKRLVLGLGGCVLALAALVAWATLGPYPEGSVRSALTLDQLPMALTGAALGLGLLLAPAWLAAGTLRQTHSQPLPRTALGQTVPHAGEAGEKPDGAADRWTYLAHAAFVGAWQAAALAFYLVLASRVTSLAPDQILPTVWLAFAALLPAYLLAARFPAAYPGLLFLWAVALPMAAYFLVEVFLTTTGGASGWQAGASPEADRLRSGIDWLLRLSPGSVTLGVLQRQLASGTRTGWLEIAAFSMLGMGGTLALLWRWPAARTASAAKP